MQTQNHPQNSKDRVEDIQRCKLQHAYTQQMVARKRVVAQLHRHVAGRLGRRWRLNANMHPKEGRIPRFILNAQNTIHCFFFTLGLQVYEKMARRTISIILGILGI